VKIRHSNPIFLLVSRPKIQADQGAKMTEEQAPQTKKEATETPTKWKIVKELTKRYTPSMILTASTTIMCVIALFNSQSHPWTFFLPLATTIIAITYYEDRLGSLYIRTAAIVELMTKKLPETLADAAMGTITKIVTEFTNQSKEVFIDTIKSHLMEKRKLLIEEPLDDQTKTKRIENIGNYRVYLYWQRKKTNQTGRYAQDPQDSPRAQQQAAHLLRKSIGVRTESIQLDAGRMEQAI
jgi:hypothetical protein